jgi:hypothetical protein
MLLFTRYRHLLIAPEQPLDISITNCRGRADLQHQEEEKMLKMCAAALVATLCYAGAAGAHGGGGAEPLPMTNYTDMPDYTPSRIAPVWLPKGKHVRWQRGFAQRCGHRKYFDPGVCGPTRCC